MKYTILIALFCSICTLIGCSGKSPYTCNCDKSFLAYNDSILDTALSDTAGLNQYHRTYNIPQLRLFGAETYRLKMSHSFSKYVQFYTLTKKEYGARLEVSQFLWSTDTSKVVEIDKRYVIKLSKDQWRTLKKRIDTSCYWTNKSKLGRAQEILDGGQWILEGFDPNQRNCANRKFNFDKCQYGSQNKLGELIRYIRSYALEYKINVYSE